ncbi:hypothetical protein LTR70_003695 [Exophiala xenobiotica]|uniref:Uncharacterized protein n=1 Tax=Lithohypha guttulata TaxID=1690604 RepID=A0ABR0KIK2_9EURO|nr:hypothetical protein LTR24_002344 [Lithohypha guttulata]KAK5322747.1 hypothetical protein LTR70_003695 [Exophiala xenobiotica]
MFDPAQYYALNGEQASLVQQVAGYTEKYFQDPKFDASHDFEHVLRVTAIAIKILEKEQQRMKSPYDALTVTAVAEAQGELIRLGLDADHAQKIQALVDGVSYTSEVKNPQKVRDLLIAIPELAIVQDADRLDAIGAIGVGRCFAYGAAKTSRGLCETMEHFDEKLFKLEGMMKTETGRYLAARYTARLKQFKDWWHEEIDFSGSLP